MFTSHTRCERYLFSRTQLYTEILISYSASGLQLMQAGQLFVSVFHIKVNLAAPSHFSTLFFLLSKMSTCYLNHLTEPTPTDHSPPNQNKKEEVCDKHHL
eukprot:TRINITY_DN31780_c0_g2_i1.p1 TRINITY_DN31780_c0_g2~~TRINITY_DN31780_c0_g2_i1.p1  ORF type:complete len:100 (-),score=3.90 TRINITY_DN31780_c0_g2_i1:288-587(-)